MNEITNGSPQEVGQFIAALRKEHGFTQKELAEQLFLSDKAVSKWERGLSMPDVSILIPLSRIFGVTTTELLLGRRTEQHTFTSEQVESLVCKAIGLSEEEKHRNQEAKRRRIPLFLAATGVAILELAALFLMGHNLAELHNTVLLVEVLMFVFGMFFTFFAPDTLPTYYDENKISGVHTAFFHLRTPGVYFNNSNWPPICKGVHRVSLLVMVLFPLLYGVTSTLQPEIWHQFQLPFTLISTFTIFIPIYVLGRKYG